MDGDSAPLAQIHAEAQRQEAWLLVDDAHGIGVTGEEGRGSCWQQQVKPELLVVTFGKGFGVSGRPFSALTAWPIICCSLLAI